MTIRKSIFLLLVLCSIAFAQYRPKIAVYVASNELRDSEKRVLSTNMLGSFIQSGQYIAIERNDAFLSSVAQERTKQRDGSVDDDQIISRLGREFGLQVVCVVDYAVGFGIRSLSARLIDLESAEIVGFGEIEMKNVDEIGRAADIVFAQVNSHRNISVGVERPKIAVYVASKELRNTEKRVLSTKILAPFIRSGKYIVVERGDAFLSNIVRERNKQRDGSVDDDQIISRLGKESGLQAVLVVDYANAFKIHSLSARLIDLESAEIVSFSKTEMSNLNEIGIASNRIFEQISGERFKETMAKCEEQGVCISVGIDVRNKEWSDNLFRTLSSNNRYDIANNRKYTETSDNNDAEFRKKYNFAIVGTGYSKTWVSCQKDCGNNPGHYTQAMNISIYKEGKQIKNFRASCNHARNDNFCSASSQIITQLVDFAKVKAEVTDIRGRDIIINRGSNSDVKVHDEFVVLGEYDKTIGKIKIHSVGPETSVAEKVRGKVSVNSNILETKPFNPSSVYLSAYLPNVTSTYDYAGKEQTRSGFNIMIGSEGIDRVSSFGGGIFIGGGKLGSDVGEFILGGEVKKLLWILNERIVLPFSVGLAWRVQLMDIENRLVASFIDEPKFLQESEDYLNKKRGISKFNFDIMPAVDLQIFISDKMSIYAGYMYRVSIDGDFTFRYKILGKNYDEGKMGDKFTVPNEFNPLKDSKEQIFGIPGTLRFGVKFHGNS